MSALHRVISRKRCDGEKFGVRMENTSSKSIVLRTKNGGMSTWEWEDSGTWKNFDGYTTGLLEGAFQIFSNSNGSPVLQLSHGFFAKDGYEVDFSTMKQKNKRTQFLRNVRRTGISLVFGLLTTKGPATKTPARKVSSSSSSSGSDREDGDDVGQLKQLAAGLSPKSCTLPRKGKILFLAKLFPNHPHKLDWKSEKRKCDSCTRLISGMYYCPTCDVSDFPSP